jgi:hypothetical protein
MMCTPIVKVFRTWRGFSGFEHRFHCKGLPARKISRDKHSFDPRWGKIWPGSTILLFWEERSAAIPE